MSAIDQYVAIVCDIDLSARTQSVFSLVFVLINIIGHPDRSLVQFINHEREICKPLCDDIEQKSENKLG